VDSLHGIGFASENIHLVFIGLEDIDIPKGFLLLRPVGSTNLFAYNFTQIALHIYNDLTNLVETMDDIEREIVGQERTKDEIWAVNALKKRLEAIPREGSCLAKHTLLAVVHVGAILVLEIHSSLTWKHLYTHTSLSKLLDSRHVLLSYCGDEAIRGTGFWIRDGKSMHTPCEIPCGTAWDMEVDVGCNDVVMRDMTDANNFAHKAVELYFSWQI
jgi:hypothetical protein